MTEQQCHIDKLNATIASQNDYIKRLEQDKIGLNAIIASMHADREQVHLDMEAGAAYMSDLEEKLY